MHRNTSLTNDQLLELNDFTMEQCFEAVNVLQRRIKQLSNADYPSYMEKAVKDLGLSNRAYNVLINSQIKTIGDIMNYGIEKIGLLKGCGSRCHQEIKDTVLKNMPIT